MLIGLDFDNTIVCYDRLFHDIARERGLIPGSLPVSKGEVRDYLRAHGDEDAWIELQGLGYGPLMRAAELFPGVMACLQSWLRAGLRVCVVSHKTRQPYSGDRADLRQAAHAWLSSRGIYGGSTGLDPSNVFFEDTKLAKLRRIAELGCDWFVDDLPEFLAEPEFPAGVRRLLFDPQRRYQGEDRFARAESWLEVEQLVLAGAVAA